jgi:hypothetical protein
MSRPKILISVTLLPEDYAQAQQAAKIEEKKVATYCREAILEKNKNLLNKN